MSGRIRGFYVALENDMKDEEFEKMKNAILMMKNVIKVEEYINRSDDYMNREMIKCELIKKLYGVLK